MLVVINSLPLAAAPEAWMFRIDIKIRIKEATTIIVLYRPRIVPALTENFSTGRLSIAAAIPASPKNTRMPRKT
ncbi:hypothetical protein D3C76_1608940 [compost metagenome]